MQRVRALSEAKARECENAVHPRCQCRCGGAAHGKARIAPDAPREEYEKLPEDDPHRLMKDKRNGAKESGHWQPGKWTPERIDKCVRAVYRSCEAELEAFIGTYEAKIVAARLRSERDEVKSVSALRARGVKLLGDEECRER